MLRGTFWLFLIMLVSCGKKEVKAVTPRVVSDELRSEISRIIPKLYWCDGQTSGSRKNNIDGRAHCDLGDAPGEGGFIAMISDMEQEPGMLNAMANSFGPDDQPFRAPSYVGKHDNNEFSRDHYLGFMMATLAGLPASKGIDRIERYANNTGSLCPHPDDKRCVVTPNMKIMLKRVRGGTPTQVEKIAEAAEIKIEAATVPLTYQAQLTANRIFMMARMNKLTTTFAAAAKKLSSREPKHLWWKIVSLVTNKGSKKDFDNVAQQLVGCMKNWQQPGAHWAWSQSSTDCTDVYGSELVAVGLYLLQAKAVDLVEDDTQPVDEYLEKNPQFIEEITSNFVR